MLECMRIITSFNMLNKLRDWLKPTLDFIVKPFLWIHPNVITLSTLLFSLGAGIALSSGDHILGAILFSGNILDMFDGHIARQSGKSTKFGGLLDTLVDRTNEGIFFFGAALGGFISFPLAFTGMFASILVSFVKAIGTAAMGETKVGTNALSIGVGLSQSRSLLSMLKDVIILMHSNII